MITLSLFFVLAFQTPTVDSREFDRDLVKSYSFPMDKDPVYVEPVPKFRQSKSLVPLWLRAFEQNENDAKRLAAVSMTKAARVKVPGVEKAIPVFIAEFEKTESLEVELALARSLSEMDAKSAADAFVKKLDSASFSLSQIIEPALAKWKVQDATEVWRKRLTSGRPKSKLIFAINGLSALGDSNSIAELGELVQGKGSPPVKLAAARAMAKIRSEGNFDLASELAKRDSEIDRMNAAKLLGSHSGDQVINLLTKLVKDDSQNVVRIAASRLFELDPGSLKTVAKDMSKSISSGVRKIAAQALLHNPDDNAIRNAFALLDDTDPALRNEVRVELAKIHSSNKFVELIEAEISGVLEEKEDLKRWRTKEQSLRLVAEFKLKDNAGDAIRHLDYAKPQVYCAAAWALNQLQIPETYPDCIEFLKRKNESLTPRVNAERGVAANAYEDIQGSFLIQAFGMSNYKESEDFLRTYIPKSQIARGDATRAAAVWSLGKILEGENDVPLAEQLYARLIDVSSMPAEVPRVRACSAITIGRLKATSLIDKLNEWASNESVGSRAGYCTAWALNQLDGRAIPPPPTYYRTTADWFLEPDDWNLAPAK